MAFGAASVVTNLGKAMFADRMRTTPGTYTVSPHFVACGVGATGAARTAAATDTALSSETETRTAGTESNPTTTLTKDTYQVVGTITYTGARAVDEMALFDASSGGNMAMSVTHLVDNFSSGDSMTYTAKMVQT